MVTAAQCKAQGRVLYNGSCQNRNNSCCGGRGYLGQVPANNGWGICIDWRTKKPCVGAAPKQVGSGSLIDLWRTGGQLPQGGAGPGSLIDLAGRGAPLPGTPGGGGGPSGIGASPSCGGCNPVDIGCAIGKQFCEFQAWLAKSVGGAAIPMLVLGGSVALIFLLKR